MLKFSTIKTIQKQ